MVGILSKKKLKITSIGISKKSLQVNDIGGPYLHKRNKVGITGIGKSKIGRAIVCDQHLIDKLYLEKEIDERQHCACNKYLDVLSRSGATVSSSSQLEKIFTGQYSSGFSRALVLVGVHRRLKEEVGRTKESRFWSLMVNSPTSIYLDDIDVISECGDVLMGYWFSGHESPVSLFQEALSNQL